MAKIEVSFQFPAMKFLRGFNRTQMRLRSFKFNSLCWKFIMRRFKICSSLDPIRRIQEV